MLAAFGGRFDQGARRLLPFVTTLLFILAGTIVWPLPYFGAVTPHLGLVAIYYWAAHRPDLLRPFGVFVLGVLHDVLGFLPLGLTAFVFVGLYQLILSHRRYIAGQAFVTLWFGFVVVMFATMTFNWIVLSLFHEHVMTAFPILLQAMLTIAFFPVPAFCLILVQRYLLAQG